MLVDAHSAYWYHRQILTHSGGRTDFDRPTGLDVWRHSNGEVYLAPVADQDHNVHFLKFSNAANSGNGGFAAYGSFS